MSITLNGTTYTAIEDREATNYPREGLSVDGTCFEMTDSAGNPQGEMVGYLHGDSVILGGPSGEPHRRSRLVTLRDAIADPEERIVRAYDAAMHDRVGTYSERWI